MRRFVFVTVCSIALLVPVAVLAGSGEGFDGVVHAIQSRYHVRATRIPFLGLVSMISRKATHGGVANLHVAEFENFNATLDGEELNRIVEEKLGPGWERMIKETSRSGQEQSLIYVRPEGQRMGMFVIDADGNELDVVQVSVDPAHLGDEISHYTHSSHEGGESD